MSMYQPDPDRLSTDKTSGATMPFDHAEFTRDVRELVAQVPEQREPEDVPREFMVRTLEAAAEEIADRWPAAAAYLQGRAVGIANRERV